MSDPAPATEPKKEETPEQKETPETPSTTTAEESKKEEVEYGEEESKDVIENKDNLVTGTEDEDLIWINKGKLYRFRDAKWKERGNGYCKLLRHKETKKIRFLLRTEKTKKVSANFYVADSPSCDLKPKTGNDKSWLFVASDHSEGEMINEKFAIMFKSKEEAEDFQEHFNKAKEFNKKNDAGETELEMAPVVEDIKEEAEQDDENKPAETS